MIMMAAHWKTYFYFSNPKFDLNLQYCKRYDDNSNDNHRVVFNHSQAVMPHTNIVAVEEKR